MSTVNVARERSLYASNAERSAPALQRDLERLREQMSTGKRVNRPSDDPDSFAVAEKMRVLGNQYARYEDSVAAARPWVDQTQAGLDQITELLTRATEEGVRASNDTLSADDRNAVADSLESLKTEVVDQLNLRHDGEYVFAGNRTADAPFDENGEPTAAYAEIGGARERPIGPGRRLAVNVSGAELHQVEAGETITGALGDLAAAVRGGDSGAIEGALASTEAARDHAADLGAKAGATSQRLSAADEQLQAAKVSVEQRRSQAEDADYLETVSDLQQMQTRLQATLKATASTLQTSLVDFL